MKRILILVLISTGMFSCSYTSTGGIFAENSCYESPRGHLFSGNRICFFTDSSFRYIVHGPSVFISEGYWKWNDAGREIKLQSVAPSDVGKYSNRVDTMWTDVSGKIVRIKRRWQLVIDETTYLKK